MAVQAVSPCPVEAQLRLYLADGLCQQEAASLESHVEQCPACESKLRSILATQTFGIFAEPKSLVGSPSTIPGTVEGDADVEPRLPRYECCGLLDVGGFGVVWKMKDLLFNRYVAVKMLKARHARHASLVRRFFAEAQLCSQLSHPYIVPVHEMGTLQDGRPYYAMKWVEGETLARKLRQGMPTATALRIFANTCQGLAFAHQNQVIHRDIKPSNIMVGVHGEAQIMDWGLAKSLAQTDASSRDGGTVAATARLVNDRTATQGVMGTYSYMPPEQFASATSVTCASDVFSLGAVLCEILLGRPPFPSRELTKEGRADALRRANQDLTASHHDAELIQVALNCLQPSPSDRPVDAGVVAASLETYFDRIQERLEAERLERERASVQLAEQRKRSRLRMTAMFSTLGVLCLLLLGGYFLQVQRAQRDQQLSLAANDLQQAEAAFQLRDSSTVGRLLSVVETRLDGTDARELIERTEELRMKHVLLNRLEEIQDKRTTPTLEGLFDNASAMRDYRDAFRPLGLDMDADDVETIASRFQELDLAERVLSPIDNWALVCNYRMIFDDPENTDAHQRQRDRLLQLGRMLSVDEAQDQLRDPQKWDSPDELLALSQSAIQESNFTPELAGLLSELLRLAGADPAELLHHYQELYRDDFWLSFNLARWYLDKDLQQTRVYSYAALALRPDNAIVMTNLGTAHFYAQQYEQARVFYNSALELYPGFVPALAERSATYVESDPERAKRELEQLVQRTGSQAAQAVLQEVQRLLTPGQPATQVEDHS